jgi:hypothetical protein
MFSLNLLHPQQLKGFLGIRPCKPFILGISYKIRGVEGQQQMNAAIVK